jgi:lipopolysaccharide export system protein LptC
MKVKKEYIILAVLIVALSLYLIFHKRDRAQYELPVLQEVPVAEITKIEIYNHTGKKG